MNTTIPNLFTKEECLSFINIAENIGFSPARCVYSDGTKNEVDTSIRDSMRCEYTSKEFSDTLFDGISGNFPGLFTGINENIRFLKYTRWQRFDKHYDASIHNGGVKEYTFIIYLSDCVGGDTVLHKFLCKDTTNIPVEIGKTIVFDKSILHSSNVVEDGVKYILVGDLYGNIPSSRSRRIGMRN